MGARQRLNRDADLIKSNLLVGPAQEIAQNRPVRQIKPSRSQRPTLPASAPRPLLCYSLPFDTYEELAEKPPSPYEDVCRVDHVPSGWRACIIKYAVRATCSTMEEADERLATANLL